MPRSVPSPHSPKPKQASKKTRARSRARSDSPQRPTCREAGCSAGSMSPRPAPTPASGADPGGCGADLLRDAVGPLDPLWRSAGFRLVARRLGEFRRIVCAAPALSCHPWHTGNAQDLAGHNCLTLHLSGRAHSTWRFRGSRGEIAVRVRGDRSSMTAGSSGNGHCAASGLSRRPRSTWSRICARAGWFICCATTRTIPCRCMRFISAPATSLCASAS
jgi:hypothetical protein